MSQSDCYALLLPFLICFFIVAAVSRDDPATGQVYICVFYQLFSSVTELSYNLQPATIYTDLQ